MSIFRVKGKKNIRDLGIIQSCNIAKVNMFPLTFLIRVGGDGTTKQQSGIKGTEHHNAPTTIPCLFLASASLDITQGGCVGGCWWCFMRDKLIISNETQFIKTNYIFFSLKKINLSFYSEKSRIKLEKGVN